MLPQSSRGLAGNRPQGRRPEGGRRLLDVARQESPFLLPWVMQITQGMPPGEGFHFFKAAGTVWGQLGCSRMPPYAFFCSANIRNLLLFRAVSRAVDRPFNHGAVGSSPTGHTKLFA